ISEVAPSIINLISAGHVDLIINTPFGREPRGDGYYIRTAAAAAGIPCVTTLPGVLAALRGVEALRGTAPQPVSLQEYNAGRRAGSRVPRRDRPARAGVRLSPEAHELPPRRRGTGRAGPFVPGAGAAR